MAHQAEKQPLILTFPTTLTRGLEYREEKERGTMKPRTKKSLMKIPSTYVPIVGLALMAIVVLVQRCEGEANAQTLRFTFGETWGISWTPEGKQSEPSPQSVFAVGVGVKIADSWTWFGDIFTTIPRTAFHPTLRPTTGVIWRDGRFTVGGSIMWQRNFAYDNVSGSHLIGLTAGPGLVITDGVVLCLIVGYRAKLQDGDIKSHIFTFGPSITLLFPL